MNIQTAVLVLALFQSATAAGQAPPENTPAMHRHFGRGTPPLSPLRDMDQRVYEIPPLRGHWTLLYFWADWCSPCIQQGIPDLIAFSKSHQHQHAEFRIVAVRFGSTHEAYEWKDFHAKTLKLEDTLWSGVPPFPVVDDDRSQMSTDWGIHALPTYALIDPKGNLVRDGDLSVLEAKLKASH